MLRNTLLHSPFGRVGRRASGRRGFLVFERTSVVSKPDRPSPRLGSTLPEGIGIDTSMIRAAERNNCGAVAFDSLGPGLRALSEQTAAPGSPAILFFRPAAIWRRRRQIAAGRALIWDAFPGVSRTLAGARFVSPQANECHCSAAKNVKHKRPNFSSPNTCVETNALWENEATT